MFNIFVNVLYVCGIVIACALTVFIVSGIGFGVVTSVKDFFGKKDKGDKNV